VPTLYEDYSRMPRGVLLLVVVGRDDRLRAGERTAKAIFCGATQIPAEDKDYVIVRSDNHGTPLLVANHGAPVAYDATYDSGEKRLINKDGGFLRLKIKGKVRSRLAAPERGVLPNVALGPRAVDALDYYGFWKLFDGLCDAAFYGTNREYALGNTPQQRFMGHWSDGVPVRELLVTDTP